MSHPKTCPECSAPMREEWQGHLYTGWHCSTPWVHEMQAELGDLRARLTAAESRAQEAETKLRAAEDAVVVLHRRCETVVPVLDEAMNLLSWLKHDLYGTGKGDYNGKIPCCQEDGEQQLVQLRATLADTARFAAQRKRQIVRQALEVSLPARRSGESYDLRSDGYQRGWNDCLDVINRTTLNPQPEGPDANTEDQ